MAYLDRLRSMAQREPRPRIRLVIRAIRDHHHLRTCHHNHRDLNDNEFHHDDLDNDHHVDDKHHDNDNRARTRQYHHQRIGSDFHHNHDRRAGVPHNQRLPRRDKHHPSEHNANNRNNCKYDLDVLIHDNPPC
jgi:hypothetical protein